MLGDELPCGDVQAAERREPRVLERDEVHRTAGADERELEVARAISPATLGADRDRVRRPEIAADDYEVRTRRGGRVLTAAVA